MAIDLSSLLEERSSGSGTIDLSSLLGEPPRRLPARALPDAPPATIPRRAPESEPAPGEVRARQVEAFGLPEVALPDPLARVQAEASAPMAATRALPVEGPRQLRPLRGTVVREGPPPGPLQLAREAGGRAISEVTEAKPLEALKRGLNRSIEGLVAGALVGGGRPFAEAPDYEPALVDKAVEAVAANLTPASALTFLITRVPGSAAGNAIIRGVVGRMAPGAAQTAFKAVAATLPNASAFAGYEAVRNAVEQPVEIARDQREGFSPAEVLGAAGRGAALGVALTPAGAIPAALPRFAAETGVFAAPSIIGGQDPASALLESAATLGAFKGAHAAAGVGRRLPERAAAAGTRLLDITRTPAAERAAALADLAAPPRPAPVQAEGVAAAGMGPAPIRLPPRRLASQEVGTTGVAVAAGGPGESPTSAPSVSAVSPSAAISSGRSGKPSSTSDTLAPGVQDPARQTSLQTVEPSETARMGSPPGSSLTGPADRVSLGVVDPPTGRSVVQPHDTVEGHVARAQRNVLEAEELGAAIAGAYPGAWFMGARPKDLSRAVEKVQAKGGLNPDTIVDYLGLRVAVDRAETARRIAGDLARSGQPVLLPEDFITSVRPDGYRAFHLQVQLRDGSTAELQLVPREIAEVQDLAHRAYGIVRAPRVNVGIRDAAVAEGRRIFDEAWQAHLQRIGREDAGEVAPPTARPQAFTPTSEIPRLEAQAVAASMEQFGAGLRAIPGGRRGRSARRLPERPAAVAARATLAAPTAQGVRVTGEYAKNLDEVPAADAPLLTGKEYQVRTPAGARYVVRNELVPAASLIPSHDPVSFAKNANYPAGVQNRPYHSDKAEQGKVVRQDQSFEPAFLVLPQPSSGGSPIVFERTNVVGSGNSRTLTLLRVFRKPEQRRAYLEALKEVAPVLGWTPEDVDRLADQQPVYVRRLVAVVGKNGERQAAPESLEFYRRFAKETNESFKQTLNPEAAAVSQGRAVSAGTLDWLAGQLDRLGEGATLAEFLRSGREWELAQRLLKDGVFTEREIGRYQDARTRTLNQDGRKLVERTLLGAAVPDSDLLQKAPAGALDKIGRSLGAVAQLRARGGEWDLAADLTEALRTATEVRAREAGSVARLRQQVSLLGEEAPNARADVLAEALIRMKPNDFKRALDGFAAEAQRDVAGQGTMFGEPRAAGEAFEAAFRAAAPAKPLERVRAIAGASEAGERLLQTPAGAPVARLKLLRDEGRGAGTYEVLEWLGGDEPMPFGGQTYRDYFQGRTSDRLLSSVTRDVTRHGAPLGYLQLSSGDLKYLASAGSGRPALFGSEGGFFRLPGGRPRPAQPAAGSTLADIDAMFERPRAKTGVLERARAAKDRAIELHANMFQPLRQLTDALVAAGRRPRPGEAPIERAEIARNRMNGRILLYARDLGRIFREAYDEGLEQSLDRYLFLRQAEKRIRDLHAASAQTTPQGALPGMAPGAAPAPPGQPPLPGVQGPRLPKDYVSPEGRRPDGSYVNPQGFDLPKIQQALADLRQLEGPQKFQRVEAAADRVWTLNRKVLDDAHAAGIVSDEAYRTIRGRGEDYVPFQVLDYIMDVGEAPVRAPSQPYSVRYQDYLRRQQGTERDVRSPVAASLDKAARAYSLIERNRAARAVTDLSAILPGVVEPVAGDTFRVPGGKDVVSVFEGGHRKNYAVPADIARAMKFLDAEQVSAAWRILDMGRKTLQAGATGANIAFATTNLLRDIKRAAVYSKFGLKAGRFGTDLPGFAADWFRGLATVYRGALLGQDDPVYRRFLESGAGFSTLQKSLTPEEFVRQSARLQTSKNPLHYLLEGARQFNSAVEEATKLQTLIRGERARARGQATPEEVAYETANYGGSPNFGRAGAWGRYVNLMWMFYNARLQGTAGDLRRIREHPKETLARLALYSLLPTTALWLWNSQFSGQQGIEDVPESEKQRSFVILTPWTYQAGDGSTRRVYLKLAKEETDQVVSTALEHAMDRTFTPYGRDAASMMVDLLGNLSPVPFDYKARGRLPQSLLESAGSGVVAGANPVLRVPAELFANTNARFGSALVPRSLKENLLPEDQARATTSPTMIRVARQLNRLGLKVSPIQLEYAVSSSTGGLGQSMIDAGDAALGRRLPETVGEYERGARFPLVSRVLGKAGGDVDRQTEERFYRVLDEAQRVAGSLGAQAEGGQATPRLLELAQDPAARVKAELVGDLREISKDLGDLRKAQTFITYSLTAPADTKRAALRVVAQERALLLRGFRALEQVTRQFTVPLPDEAPARRLP